MDAAEGHRAGSRVRSASSCSRSSWLLCASACLPVRDATTSFLMLWHARGQEATWPVCSWNPAGGCSAPPPHCGCWGRVSSSQCGGGEPGSLGPRDSGHCAVRQGILRVDACPTPWKPAQFDPASEFPFSLHWGLGGSTPPSTWPRQERPQPACVCKAPGVGAGLGPEREGGRRRPRAVSSEGSVRAPYARLLFTRGSVPFNFTFTPEARAGREHGVLTLPRLSAAEERRLCVVTVF